MNKNEAWRVKAACLRSHRNFCGAWITQTKGLWCCQQWPEVFVGEQPLCNSMFTSFLCSVPYQVLIFPPQHHNQPPGTCLQDHQLEIWAEAGHEKGGESLSACEHPSPVRRRAKEEITVNDMIHKAGGCLFVFFQKHQLISGAGLGFQLMMSFGEKPSVFSSL